jgi:hypothetical protein
MIDVDLSEPDHVCSFGICILTRSLFDVLISPCSNIVVLWK